MVLRCAMVRNVSMRKFKVTCTVDLRLGIHMPLSNSEFSNTISFTISNEVLHHQVEAQSSVRCYSVELYVGVPIVMPHVL